VSAIRVAGVCVLLSSWCLSPATAQTPAEPHPPVTALPDIVVSASQPAAIATFVQKMLDPGKSDQLPRWDRSLCSGVAGLQSDQAEQLNGRIGQIAQIARLRLDPAGCLPNTLIVFTTEAASVAASVARRYRSPFAATPRPG